MKGLYLVLLLAGNLFSQTATEAVVSDSMMTLDGIIFPIPITIEATDISTTDSVSLWVTQSDIDSSWVMIVGTTAVTGIDSGHYLTLDFQGFQDCQGDDLMFNYVSDQIQEIDRASFGDSQASDYLIQAPEVLKAYQWMRRNRGNKYTIHQMVVRVNRWYQGGD